MGVDEGCVDAGESWPPDEVPALELLTALEAAMAGERLDAITV